MGRPENIEVFEDTEKFVKENGILKEAIRNSTKNQKLILENDNYISDEERAAMIHKYSDMAKVIVSKKRSYEAASNYPGKKVMVHNFASATTPGGGVVKGSGAQEECLCRTSTLYFSLNTKEMWDGFYSPHRAANDPKHNDDLIYTPDVYVIKSDTMSPKRLSEVDWYKVNVVTCAAPNLRLMPTNRMNASDGKKPLKISDAELLQIHEKKMRRIFDVSMKEGNEVLILGAFGCGAFQNNPEVVARAMKNVVKEYINAFEIIEFAVCCRPGDEANFKTFERQMGEFS